MVFRKILELGFLGRPPAAVGCLRDWFMNWTRVQEAEYLVGKIYGMLSVKRHQINRSHNQPTCRPNIRSVISSVCQSVPRGIILNQLKFHHTNFPDLTTCRTMTTNACNYFSQWVISYLRQNLPSSCEPPSCIISIPDPARNIRGQSNKSCQSASYQLLNV